MDQEFNMYVWEFTTYKNYWRYNFSGFCLIMPADFVKRLEAYAARMALALKLNTKKCIDKCKVYFDINA